MTTPSASTAPAIRQGWVPALGALAGRLVLGWVLVLTVMVGLGLAVTGPLATRWPLTVEDDASRALEGGRTPLGDTVSFWLSALGNTSTIVPLCLICMLALRWALQRWRDAIMVGMATVGQSVVFLCTTLVIDRERPDVEQMDVSPPTSSFPSGHTSAAIALYVSLALVMYLRLSPWWARWSMMLLLALLPVGVAIGRLYRGMHHPSDVAGSVVNAGLVLLITYLVVSRAPLPEDEPERAGRDRS